MAGTGYRVYFGDKPATQDELDHIEEVTVEQTMDHAWQATVQLVMCTDEKGKWQHSGDSFAKPFSRLRLELRVSGSSFVPLIDGPVAAYAHALDSQPGRSGVTLVAHDDSVLMDREEDTEVFDNRTDDNIATEVFGRVSAIDSTRIKSSTGPEHVAVRRGTLIQFLRELARANGFHAYVLPGDERGKSIGCFLPDPSSAGKLPPLILLGADRNLENVQIQENSDAAEQTKASNLSLKDQSVTSATTRLSDVALLGPRPPVTDSVIAHRLVPPEDIDRADPTGRSQSQARRASYALRMSGRLIPGCNYGAVLTPYQRVTLKAGNLPLSGEWLLTKVTHRLTSSFYTQEFEAKTDSKQDPGASASGGGLGLSVAASVSVSVF